MHENMFLQQYGDVSPISKVSAVNSGCSPMTQEGKSNKAMLKQWKLKKKKIQPTSLEKNPLILTCFYWQCMPWYFGWKTSKLMGYNWQTPGVET